MAVRKGRITNILVEPDKYPARATIIEFASPYTVFSPGLAGVSRNERYVSDGVLLRTLARGDANVVLRNILFRLTQKEEWQNFESDLAQIFPTVGIEVHFDQAIDQFISININDSGKSIPLDLAGTGLLQAIKFWLTFIFFLQRL